MHTIAYEQLKHKLLTTKHTTQAKQASVFFDAHGERELSCVESASFLIGCVWWGGLSFGSSFSSMLSVKVCGRVISNTRKSTFFMVYHSVEVSMLVIVPII